MLIGVINWQQGSEERTPILEGKILNFECELKNSISNILVLNNKLHLSGDVREAAGSSSPALEAGGSGYTDGVAVRDSVELRVMDGTAQRKLERVNICSLPKNREKPPHRALLSHTATEPKQGHNRAPSRPYLLSLEKDHSLHFGVNILTQLLFKFFPSITNVWHFNWALQDHGHKALWKKGEQSQSLKT